ncbi:MAG TPA: ISL3 family transposase [Ktedonobacteraceae bacterium]
MPTTPLFPLPEGLEMTSLNETSEQLLVRVTSHRSSSLCPQCSTPSSAIHSYYRRHPRDLPCTGRPIRLVLTVRKFFCRNPDCTRNVFTERLPDFLQVSSRLTKRLRTAVQEVGFATCGKGGERLSDKLGMPISDATVIWSLFLVPLPEVGKVRVVGIDDWSWRRGKRFGSIIVNLETHKIIGLLADREAESVQKWLTTHPEVEIVSRDRGGTYVDGATWGAPQATQVADRWHILSNLGDAVEAFLIRAHIRLPEKTAASGECQKLNKPLSSFSATPASQRKSQARLLRKWKLYQRVHELYTSGMSLRKIGEELGLARNTVRKYFRQPPEPPLPTPRPLRASRLDPYEDYLLERWSQGERNAGQLYREISERGYPGSATMVRAYIAHLRTTTADGSPPRSRKARAKACSPRALRRLLARKRDDLDQEEQTRLNQLLNISPEVQAVHALLQAFLKMVRERNHQALRSWMKEATRSGIPELKSFAAGIERDYDAVHAALRLPWSQGTTEGKVNKLKTLKRVMYGRAGFALLRQRLLHDA